MNTPGSPGSVRLVRGTVAATVTTAVALASHVAGGGAVPGWLGVLAPWAVTLWLCTLLAGRQVARWRTASSVAIGQVLFHTLFVLGTPTGTPPATGPHAGHAMPDPFTPSATTVDLVQADAQMWSWHAAAAVATFALLYRGERNLLALRRVARRVTEHLAPRWVDVGSTGLQGPPTRVTIAARDEHPVLSRPQLRPLWRRGPPALSAS